MSRAKDFQQRNTGVTYRQDWETPADLFAKIDAEFHFTIDVAASFENRKCDWYFDRVADGLSQHWGHNTVWLNPPYDASLAKWVAKARDAAAAGATVVCLIPARTDTRWWHDYALMADEIRFIRGRVHYIPRDKEPKGGGGGAPFPSCILVFTTRQSAVEICDGAA